MSPYASHGATAAARKYGCDRTSPPKWARRMGIERVGQWSLERLEKDQRRRVTVQRAWLQLVSDLQKQAKLAVQRGDVLTAYNAIRAAAISDDRYRLELGIGNGKGGPVAMVASLDHQRDRHLNQGLGRTSNLKPAGQTG